MLLTGLALGFNAAYSAVGNSTGAEHVVALVGVVVAAVVVTLGVGGLVIGRRWNRR
jgi:hypothetical protein